MDPASLAASFLGGGGGGLDLGDTSAVGPTYGGYINAPVYMSMPPQTLLLLIGAGVLALILLRKV